MNHTELVMLLSIKLNQEMKNISKTLLTNHSNDVIIITEVKEREDKHNGKDFSI